MVCAYFCISPYFQRMGDKPQVKEVPETVCNSKKEQVLTRGKFLGKGGFARCYELVDSKTNAVYAGKIVSKLLLQKKHQKEKVEFLSILTG